MNSEEKDIMMQSNINIADSITDPRHMNAIIADKFSGCFNMQSNAEQIEEEQKDEEIVMEEQPKIYESKKYFEDSQDVWNDPDLVPVVGNDEEQYFQPEIN